MLYQRCGNRLLLMIKANNLVLFDHDAIRNCLIWYLTSNTFLYWWRFSKTNGPKFKRRFFSNIKFLLGKKQLLTHNVTICNNVTITRMFQYKTLKNILFSNKIVFKFRIVSSPLCLFSKTHTDTVLHLCHGCLILQYPRNQLKVLQSLNLDIFFITSQSVIFGLFDTDCDHLILNYLLLGSNI